MAVDELRIGGLHATRTIDEIQIGGLGARRKRVEDARFVRGKGHYLDDFKLPRMLHMEILRSPVAHARIISIDTSRAWMTPGVHLVVTGDMAAQHNLAWMPTLSYDTQAVLATDKVRFQGQEVACVIADDPYIAKDACEAIEVVYGAPHYDLFDVVTPSPHHPLGCKGIGECGCVGGPAAFVNAVTDAVAHLGVRNIDMPCLPGRVWEAIRTKGDVPGTPPLAGP